MKVLSPPMTTWLLAALAVASPATAAEPDARITAAPSRVELEVGTTRGHVDIDVDGMPGLPSARFVASALRQAFVFEESLPVDTTPDNPYDDLSQVRVLDVGEPSFGSHSPGTRHFVVRADGRGAQVRVFAGADGDGNGLPSLGEERCRGDAAAVSACIFARDNVYVYTRWWVVIQRVAGDASNVRIETASVPIACAPSCSEGGDLYATGPGHVAPGDAFRIRFGWDASSLGLGRPHLGSLQIQHVPGVAVATVPVRLVPRDLVAAPTVLERYEEVFLRPGERHDRLFFDVPPGAAELDFNVRTQGTTSDDQEIRYRVDYAGAVPAGPLIGPTPDPSGTNLGEYILRPAPGRYFLTIENVGDIQAHVASRPVIRMRASETTPIGPGSYYNVTRPGHGVFLYPAGLDGALLWYTYRDDGTPTWYYAQGRRTAETPWVWPLYRASWDGVARHLAPVGHVVLTNRTKSGGISYTWEIDGETGSESLRPWLTGCGDLDGAPLDVNGHWYHESSPGFGFSVQTHPDYEFIAGFLFDGNGEPRFLAAERGGAFDAAASPVPLYQLKGFAPTAPWTSPVRTDVGVLGRIYSEAGIDQIAVEATYVDGVPGTWSSSAPVRQLGEPVGCP